MVTENVNININARGDRTVKRKFDEIGHSVDRATRSLYLMQRALFVIGAGGILRGLQRSLDTLTNYENRLRLTASSTANMEKVQQSLFDVARRSRTEFESVAEIYSRTALSVRQLGVSQQETLQFTESLAKATIISGANAREANAALVQLSQGLASNRLSGDELRSVLEQIPYVADIIVDELNRMSDGANLTRGDLREMGAEGKISAELVLRAVRNAREEIDGKFRESAFTIAQAFTVLRTEAQRLLDQFDDFVNVGQGVATVIIAIADNLGNLVGILTTVGAGFAAAFAGRGIKSLYDYIAAQRALRVAVAEGNAVLLTSTAIEEAKALSLRASALATTQKAGAEVAQLRIQQQQLQQTVAQITIQRDLAAEEALLARVQAQVTGNTQLAAAATANYNRQTVALINSRRALAATETALTTATGVHTAALATLNSAQERARIATAANDTLFARMQARFPLMAAGLGYIATGFNALTAAMAANPFGAALVAITLLTVGLLTLGDNFLVVADKGVTLKDITLAVFSIIGDGVRDVVGLISSAMLPAINLISSAFGTVYTSVSQVFMDILRFIKDFVNTGIGLVLGLVNGIVAVFPLIPSAAGDAAAQAANLFIDGFQKLANGAIAAINKVIQALNKLIAGVAGTKLGELLGIEGQLNEINNVDLSGYKATVTGAAREAGSVFKAEMESALGTDYIGNAADVIVDRAAEIRRQRDAEAALEPGGPNTTGGGAGGGGGGGGGGGSSTSLAKLLGEIDQEINLLRLSNAEREIQEGLLDIEKKLKRDLTQAETELATAKLKQLQVAKEESKILDQLQGPQEQVKIQLAAINNLFQMGKIDIEEYNKALAEVAVTATSTANTFAGGLSNGLAKISQMSFEFGQNVSDWLVGAFNSATDAIVEFAKTGEFNVRQFFQDLFAQLLKLATNALFSKLIGGLFGLPTSSLGFGAFAIPGFATGGSFPVGGSGGTDSQLVAFKASPDERVDVLTPRQQKAQAEAMANGGGGGGQTVVQSPPVNVAAVLSPKDIYGAFDTPEGQTTIIRVLEQNPSAVRALVQGG